MKSEQVRARVNARSILIVRSPTVPCGSQWQSNTGVGLGVPEATTHWADDRLEGRRPKEFVSERALRTLTYYITAESRSLRNAESCESTEPRRDLRFMLLHQKVNLRSLWDFLYLIIYIESNSLVDAWSWFQVSEKGSQGDEVFRDLGFEDWGP